MGDVCVCGHIFDEHGLPGPECKVEGCDCIYFTSEDDDA